MNRGKDPMEEIIKEDLLIEAESVSKKIETARVEELSIEDRERIRKKLHARIDEYEKERVYKSLSEEDRKALELGRQMLKERKNSAAEETVVRYKKSKKVWFVLAAVLVLVMAIGVPGIGGAERIVEIARSVVGSREVVKVNSEDNYVISKEKEEEAYQELKDVFGVEAVKIIHRPDGMEFVAAEIDRELQTATLRYEYEGQSIHYHISSHYTDSSWGIDVEDEVLKKYSIYHDEKGDMEIIEYQKPESKTRRYSINYTHDGLEYMLIGVMKLTDFEEIIKNLVFF